MLRCKPIIWLCLNLILPSPWPAESPFWGLSADNARAVRYYYLGTICCYVSLPLSNTEGLKFDYRLSLQSITIFGPLSISSSRKEQSRCPKALPLVNTFPIMFHRNALEINISPINQSFCFSFLLWKMRKGWYRWQKSQRRQPQWNTLFQYTFFQYTVILCLIIYLCEEWCLVYTQWLTLDQSQCWVNAMQPNGEPEFILRKRMHLLFFLSSREGKGIARPMQLGMRQACI